MKLVVFDVDGTLVDSQNLIVAAQRATFAAHGMEPPSRERSLSIVGLSLVEAFTVLAGPAGPVESLVEGYRDAFALLRADPAHEEPLFPGAASLLEALRRRPDVVLAIATGKSQRGVAHLLERHGWNDVFSIIRTADDAPSKPHPAMLEQALAEAGIEAREALMIGDTSFDMLMARSAGIEPIGVSWGYHRVEKLRQAGADLIVDSYPELRQALARRWLPGLA